MFGAPASPSVAFVAMLVEFIASAFALGPGVGGVG
jgi:hypothetical protein